MTTVAVRRMSEWLDLARSSSGSCVCVGLDPDPAKMPIDDVFEFNRAIIDATQDLIAAYKPQFAFYEAMGRAGFDALEKTIRHVRDVAPHAFVLADAKRGDIGNTAEAYAKAMFEVWDVNAVTVYAYQGSESVLPFLEYRDRGVFVVCRTSNPSSVEVQDIVDDRTGEMVYEVRSQAGGWYVGGCQCRASGWCHLPAGTCVFALFVSRHAIPDTRRRSTRRGRDGDR